MSMFGKLSHILWKIKNIDQIHPNQSMFFGSRLCLRRHLPCRSQDLPEALYACRGSVKKPCHVWCVSKTPVCLTVKSWGFLGIYTGCMIAKLVLNWIVERSCWGNIFFFSILVVLQIWVYDGNNM